jgi:tetratricopeptide (TPR) repeat protein
MQRKPRSLFFVAVLIAAVSAGAGCDKLRARDKLNKGVQAYRNAQFDVAIENFKQAKQLDPTLTNAQLYLATAYASQYVPGAPSQENSHNGEQALAEFKTILDNDPRNLSALDGIGSMLYNIGSTPYDAKKLEESKSYHQKHIEISPNDPEPYYWVGVIDWALAFRGNKDVREEYSKNPKNIKKQLKENDALPPALAKDFAEKFGPSVDDGISHLQQAITLRPDYDDAMAYLNLLYRQKADTETTTEARDADLKQADDLVDKVKATKQKKANMQPNN